MANQNPSLRFDHREIAVIFSLFIFVSLLMFTVGILVGKGLAQAKYENILLSGAANGELPRGGQANDPHHPADAAATENHGGTEAPTAEAAPPANANAEAVEQASASQKSTPPVAKKEPAQPLKLIPQHAKNPDLNGGSLQEPNSQEAAHILKDPKIRALLDDGGAASPTLIGKNATGGKGKRLPSSTAPGAIPPSFNKGPYTVQVGSYPTQKDATERVAALKKLGFPHAYFSSQQLGDKKETWFRVWLGYYPDKDSAEKSGAVLQERGEVKNYLVRETDKHS